MDCWRWNSDWLGAVLSSDPFALLNCDAQTFPPETDKPKWTVTHGADVDGCTYWSQGRGIQKRAEQQQQSLWCVCMCDTRWCSGFTSGSVLRRPCAVLGIELTGHVQVKCLNSCTSSLAPVISVRFTKPRKRLGFICCVICFGARDQTQELIYEKQMLFSLFPISPLQRRPWKPRGKFQTLIVAVSEDRAASPCLVEASMMD